MTTWSQSLIDNFNDNSLDTTTVWTNGGSGFVTETSAQLHIFGDGSYPYVKTKKTHNVTNEIFAVRWIPGSGTTTSSCTYILTLDDPSNNQIILAGNATNSAWQFQSGGAATVSGTLTGTGLGTSLSTGYWFGIGRIQSDNLCFLYSSTDGVTWTSLGSALVGGTFDKTKVQFRIQAGHYTGTESPSWTFNVDQAAVWSFNDFDKTHVRSGGAWVESSVKVRSGGAWVGAKPKVRVGGAWVVSH